MINAEKSGQRKCLLERDIDSRIRDANAARKQADIKAAVRMWRQKLMYSNEYIFSQVAWQFYLAPQTVARIYWGEYDRQRERAAQVPLRKARRI